MERKEKWSTVLIQKRREKFKAPTLLKSVSQKEFLKDRKNNPQLQRNLMKERSSNNDWGVREADPGLSRGGKMGIYPMIHSLHIPSGV